MSSWRWRSRLGQLLPNLEENLGNDRDDWNILKRQSKECDVSRNNRGVKREGAEWVCLVSAARDRRSQHGWLHHPHSLQGFKSLCWTIVAQVASFAQHIYSTDINMRAQVVKQIHKSLKGFFFLYKSYWAEREASSVSNWNLLNVHLYLAQSCANAKPGGE